MIDFISACQAAQDFFGRHTGVPELAQCRENDRAWFFVNGALGEFQVGGLIVVVRKKDGGLDTIDIPTEEECAELREAASILLPPVYSKREPNN